MPTPTGGGVTTAVPIASDYRIDSLRYGRIWGTGAGTPVTLTYSFAADTSLFSSSPTVGYGYAGNELTQFSAMTTAQQDAARRALQAWSEVANITFQEVSESSTQVGELRFANSGVVGDEGAAAWAYYPFSGPVGGDVWFDPNYAPNFNLDDGGFGYSAMLHEIGHALGLSHPFYSPGSPGKPVLPAAEDNQRYTIMAYANYAGATVEASTPMLYDILAIQYLYGANMSTRAGDDSYSFSSARETLQVIWDAGGHDTIDLSNQSRNQVIDLHAGSFSSIGIKNNGQTAVGNVGIAFGVTIEDATGGSGSDQITGNAAANRLRGGAGNDTLSGDDGEDTLEGGANNDTLIGGAGNDLLKGGAGNDTYALGAGDTIDEEANADQGDLVLASVNVDLAIVGSGAVEHATLSGNAALSAFGNGSVNRLTGNDAANLLDGRGGADILAGNNGNDTYVVDDAGDQVIETATGGIDLVQSLSLSYTLGAYVENLTLAGVGDIGGTGNTLRNIVTGNGGANRLDGGAGNDTMIGGDGNDTYVIDSLGDVASETATGGIDTIEAAFNLSLVGRANIENLRLAGAALNGTGNASANQLTGNGQGNLLDGGGGADLLKGGAGNDTYLLDNLADTVDEEGNTDSADLIKTTARISAGFAGVENYTYLGTLGWTFAGNALDNTIIGGTGNDVLAGMDGNDWLDGRGGADVLKGGAGNDTYVIAAASDLIDEEANADSGDWVRATLSVNLLTLAAGALEHAMLLGTAAFNATGNAAANELIGNSGANKLDGGAGADLLDGGKGADTYYVDDAGDQVVELIAGAAGGVDIVRSAVTFTLGANVEKLILTGAADLDGFGNGLNNTLTGNDGANRLDGGGGSDAMNGGKGDDTYVVNAAGDVVSETVANGKGGGIDTVESSVTYSLAARANVDNLILTGTAAINGTGNALANEIVGNAASNLLSGGGGADVLVGGGGLDRLTGGTGRDTFAYALIAEAGDTITDFVKGAAGDILDLADLLDSFGGPLDPFGGGYLAFAQSGKNTLVQVDATGGMDSATTLATLLNVHLTEADTANYIV